MTTSSATLQVERLAYMLTQMQNARPGQVDRRLVSVMVFLVPLPPTPFIASVALPICCWGTCRTFWEVRPSAIPTLGSHGRTPRLAESIEDHPQEPFEHPPGARTPARTSTNAPARNPLLGNDFCRRPEGFSP